MSRRREKAHPCPTPSKRRFSDISEAAEAYRANLADPVAIAAGHVIADHGYLCRCGWWHRTSLTTGKDSVPLS